MVASVEKQVFDSVLAALDEKTASREHLESVFRKAFSAEYGRDSASLHNMGILAARAGLEKEALAFALDKFDDTQFHSACGICAIFLENKNYSGREKFEELLQKLSEAGHFGTKKLLFSRRVSFLGPLRFVADWTYSVILFPQIFRVANSDMDDPRLNHVPGRKSGDVE